MSAVLNSWWSRTRAGRFRTAIVLSICALLARAVVDPLVGDKHQFVPFYVATAAVVWLGSWPAGALTAAIGAATIELFPPVSSKDTAAWHIAAAYASYLSTSTLIVLAIEAARRRKDELARRLSSQAESERRVGEFLALLGHELRNPLATITMAEGLIRGGRLDASSLEGAWNALERQTGQIKRLAGDLLDLARVRQGKLTVTRQPLNVNVMIEEAISDARPLLAEKSQRVVHAPAAADVFVLADRDRMAQVLGNLIHNASKFSPPHSSIRIRTSRSDTGTEITVQDEGVGIARGELERVFEPFMQLPPRAAGAQGLGLGLPLTRSLVQAHGGTIRAASAGVGCGAEFVITLPAVPADWPAPPPGQAHAPDPTRSGAPPSAVQKLKLLVVDDNPDAAATLALLLRLKGHETHTADGGAAALRVAAQEQPDLVFLDLGLPDMDGVEVAMGLRHLAIRQPRVVALTGWDGEHVAAHARGARFDGHLTKPVSIEELDRALLLAGSVPGHRVPQELA